jgi:putative serine protease PepD
MLKKTTLVGGLAAVGLAGAGVGATVYAAAAGGTRTVTAAAAAPAPARVASTSGTLTVGALYASAVQGVVEVDASSSSRSSGYGFGFGGGGNGSSSTAQGTGFVYDSDGHVVTNEHVVSGASTVKVKLHDGSTYTATVVGTDPSTDLAVLKITAPASALHPLALGDSGAVKVGDGVVAIGDPFGLDDSVTTGIVSAVGREITAPDNSPIEGAIQTDAAINHGNSGGPLLDLNGKVIGITAQIESDSGGNDGVGFAIPSNLVKQIAGRLISGGSIAHPLLGVEAATLPQAAATQLGEAAGVAVATVQPGSAAAAAGLKAATGSATVAGQQYPTGGDVITKVDGGTVATADDLRASSAKHAVGDTIELTVVRGGQTRTVKAKLGSR